MILPTLKLWSALLLVTSCLYGSAARADEASACAAAAPELKRLALEAATFQAAIEGTLPADLRAQIANGQVSAVIDQITQTASLPQPVRDYMIALVRLEGPLMEYTKQVAAASVATEACATSK